MLRKLKVDNFKCLDDFEIEFDGHALLMGLNGSGKSTFIEVLDRLRRFLAAGVRADDAFPVSTHTQWRPDKRKQFFELELDDGLSTAHLKLVVGPVTGPDGLDIGVIEEEITGIDCGLHRRHGAGTTIEYAPGDPLNENVLVPDELAALRLVAFHKKNGGLANIFTMLAALDSYRLVPSQMSSLAVTGARVLTADGANIASWLLSRTEEQREKVANVARASMPSFGGFRFEEVPTESFRLWTQWAGDIRSEEFRFDSLSDGQKIIIVLAAVIEHIGAAPVTIVLDEADNYVALQEIQPLLLSLMDMPNVQLIVASHHPEVINLMARDYGYVFSREDEVGPVRVKRFEAPPETVLTPAELVARGEVDGRA